MCIQSSQLIDLNAYADTNKKPPEKDSEGLELIINEPNLRLPKIIINGQTNPILGVNAYTFYV
ncbi:hypothetical protein NCCP2716_29320 [Sporosarcina sp. NCCP-2716]|nr:hypothetical protein NCCP2716_29320 [Sporosarcina sp. NCCP-2716]